MLDELQEIDGAVEERRFKLAFKIDVATGLDTLDVIRDVDESADVDGKLAKDGANDVWVENIWLWALFG